MKKTTTILLTILLVALSSSYSQENFEKNTYELTDNLKSKSSTIYIKENTTGELLCVKERFKTTSSKVTYSFYLYNKDKKLLKSSLLKIKPINKVFFQNDSIYLIRYKKEHLEISQEEKDAAEYGLGEDVTFNLLDKVNFSILSSSTKDFKFEEQKWFTIKNEGTHWETNPDKFETYFFENSSENKLLHLSSFSYLPNEQELKEVNYKILASDSLKRTKFYSSTFYIDFLDKNLKQELTKKVIISNNIGPFSIEKQLIDYNSKTLYLLLSTLDKKKSKLISLTSSINTQYHLLKICEDNSITHTTIKNPPHTIATINMEFFNDDIICAGMYSDTNNSKINGFCKLNFDQKDLSQKSEFYSNFTNSFLDDTKPILSNSTSYRRFKEFSFDYIHIDKNGNCVINIEEYYIQRNSAPMPLASVPVGAFSVGLSIDLGTNSKVQEGIITAKISNDNKLLWARYLETNDRRNQYFLSKNINGVNHIIKNDIPLTYRKFVTGKDYIDNPEDDYSIDLVEDNNTNYKVDYKNDYLYSMSISNLGKLNNSRFFSHKKSYKIDFNHLMNSTNSNDDFYISIKMGKKFQIVKLNML